MILALKQGTGFIVDILHVGKRQREESGFDLLPFPCRSLKGRKLVCNTFKVNFPDLSLATTVTATAVAITYLRCIRQPRPVAFPISMESKGGVRNGTIGFSGTPVPGGGAKCRMFPFVCHVWYNYVVLR